MVSDNFFQGGTQLAAACQENAQSEGEGKGHPGNRAPPGRQAHSGHVRTESSGPFWKVGTATGPTSQVLSQQVQKNKAFAHHVLPNSQAPKSGFQNVLPASQAGCRGSLKVWHMLSRGRVEIMSLLGEGWTLATSTCLLPRARNALNHP